MPFTSSSSITTCCAGCEDDHRHAQGIAGTAGVSRRVAGRARHPHAHRGRPVLSRRVGRHKLVAIAHAEHRQVFDQLAVVLRTRPEAPEYEDEWNAFVTVVDAYTGEED